MLGNILTDYINFEHLETIFNRFEPVLNIFVARYNTQVLDLISLELDLIHLIIFHSNVVLVISKLVNFCFTISF